MEKIFSILFELCGAAIFGVISGSLGALAMSESIANTQAVSKTPCRPGSWTNCSLYRCAPAGMRGPIRIVWVNLTPLSLQRQEAMALDEFMAAKGLDKIIDPLTKVAVGRSVIQAPLRIIHIMDNHEAKRRLDDSTAHGRTKVSFKKTIKDQAAHWLRKKSVFDEQVLLDRLPPKFRKRVCTRDAKSGRGGGGRPAPLASRSHRIPTRFPLNLHAIAWK